MFSINGCAMHCALRLNLRCFEITWSCTCWIITHSQLYGSAGWGVDNREDAYSRTGGNFHMGYGTGCGIFIVIQWSIRSYFIESQWICRIPYENASRTGVRILPNLSDRRVLKNVELWFMTLLFRSKWYWYSLILTWIFWRTPKYETWLWSFVIKKQEFIATCMTCKLHAKSVGVDVVDIDDACIYVKREAHNFSVTG